MKIYNTADPQIKPSIFMLVYGHGGTGKTTFSSTAPKPVLADCEGGAKYFGIRGIEMDKADIIQWSDMREFYEAVAKSEHETIVIDPIGELMEKLMNHMRAMGNSKLVQSDGSPSMAGWGWLKDNMRKMLKSLRDINKHVIIIAHVDEKDDEGRLVQRPKIMTKLSEELVNMVDIVGLATRIQTEEGEKYAIQVDTTSDKYIAKDRTGQLGKIIPPDFTKIVEAINGTKKYSWAKQPEQQEEEKAPPKKPASKKAALNEKAKTV